MMFMNDLHGYPRIRRPRYFWLVSTAISSLVIILAMVSLSSNVALAKSLGTSGQGQFTKQFRLGFHSGDDWEPAIATDRYGHVYVMYKHYNVSGGGTCYRCNLHVLVQVSNDEGKTWSDPRAIAPIAVKGGQYDSQIAVDPADGRAVWASFLQNSNSLIDVVKSVDFGKTWSAPMTVTTRPAGLDKDELAVRGKTIVVAYDDNFNTWVSISLDGGFSWKTHEVFPTSNTFSISLAAGAAIDSHGNIFVSWDSFDKANRNSGNGPSTVWVSKSTDHGKHWTRTVIDTSAAAPTCNSCGWAFLSSQMALRIGSDNTIYLLWNGSAGTQANAPQRIFFAKSTDDGSTYTPRIEISDAPQGVENCFPAIAVGKRPGDVRLGWMDMRTGAWNVFYRSSRDGGKHLSATVRISGYVSGYSYLTKQGFAFPYGDYFSMVVDQDNLTQMAFGEGPSYAGPGNIWVSHEVND
jgi:hypothetical protein